jgi:manganese transport protein
MRDAGASSLLLLRMRSGCHYHVLLLTFFPEVMPIVLRSCLLACLSTGNGFAFRHRSSVVSFALVVAWAVNVAILVVGAGLQGAGGVDDIFTAYASIAVALGSTIAVFFGIALLASGLASTAVGAYAGGEIMSGLLNIRVPLIWRRVFSIIPAIVFLALGVNPLLVLVISQVVLSFGISFALIPLISFTRNRDLMGDGTNTRGTTALAIVAAALIIALNVALLVLSFTGMG